MTFGDKVYSLRVQRKMTMEELANLIGVQKSAISKYEKGIVVNPKRSTIAALCRVFNVPPSYFLDDDFSTLTEQEAILLNAYRSADDRAREDALKTLLDHPQKKEEPSAM